MGCDLFEEKSEGASTPYEPLTIRGETTNGDTVEIVINTTRTVPRAILTPMSGDTYVLWLNRVIVSEGTISYVDTLMTFYPSNGGQSFTTRYTSGETVTLYEIPTADGGLITGTGPSSTGPSPAELAAASLATELNALYGAGTVAVSADKVTFLKDFDLKKTQTIPGGVTLVVPKEITLTVDYPAIDSAKNDPDNINGDGTAGSGSSQITGDGKLEVRGDLVARNRTIRVTTEIYSTASYKMLLWDGAGDYTSVPLVGEADIVSLSGNESKITITWNTGSSYNFALTGRATVNSNKAFPLKAPDNVTIQNNAVLTIASGGSITPADSTTGSGTIKLDGTLVVSSGATLELDTDVKIASNSANTGILEVSGKLIAATIPNVRGTLKFKESAKLDAGGWNVISALEGGGMYSVGENATIEMKITAHPEYSFTFRGGQVRARKISEGSTTAPSQTNVYIQVPHIVETDAEFLIPGGSMVIIVGNDGSMVPYIGDSTGALTVKGNGKITVEGELSVDGSKAKIEVPTLTQIVTNGGKISYYKLGSTTTDTGAVAEGYYWKRSGSVFVLSGE